MTTLLAVDPGNTHSGWVVIDTDTRRPLRFGKTENTELRQTISAGSFDDCAIARVEMVASYGMAVGAEVFETCVEIGRLVELLEATGPGRRDVNLVKRHPVKLHHCYSARASDTNIRQALVDRFAAGQSNHGKGTKTNPGWFYGFHADIWQAYALAVYTADTEEVPARCNVASWRAREPARPGYIYVASSWRNPAQPGVVAALRAAGISCYDFRNPVEGDHGFAWSDIDPDWQSWTAKEYVTALEHPRAADGFDNDFAAMQRADTCVLVLPCGRSAHLELGWAVGAGKRTAILLNGDHEPELMVKMVDHIAIDLPDLLAWLEDAGGDR